MQGTTLNKYIAGFILIYLAAAAILAFRFHQPVDDILIVMAVFGIVLPFLSFIILRNTNPPITEKPAFRYEWMLILALALLIVWYISYGTGLINQLAAKSILQTPWKNELFILAKKLLVFVLVPFLAFRMFRFGLKDFGFTPCSKLLFNKPVMIAFIVLSALVLLFQYYVGHGAQPLRKGMFTAGQLLIGLPLCFAWLFIEAGLVEEFFYRAILQTRISVLVKSKTAGILISGLVFGLSHAPGLYLRGAGSEGIEEQLPFIFWAAFTIVMMSMAGIFLGIIFSKTKNIWLVMALHAMVDLLPNFGDFVDTWHI
jgi:uncharacterized protein